MEHVHYEINANGGDVAVVTINHQANVLLLDPSNYHSYCGGRPYRYFGGWRTASPVRLSVPHSGHWHIAIDLAGRSGTIRSSVQVV
jgi:Domain of unknown function (DUF1883)